MNNMNGLPQEFRDKLQTGEAVIARFPMGYFAPKDYLEDLTDVDKSLNVNLTVAMLLDQGCVFIGFAQQSDKDCFNKKRGAYIAVQRALKQKDALIGNYINPKLRNNARWFANAKDPLTAVGLILCIQTWQSSRLMKLAGMFGVLDDVETIKSKLRRFKLFEDENASTN